MLVFKATQTVNFAQGAIALVGAWFAQPAAHRLARSRVAGSATTTYVVWFGALIVGARCSPSLLGLVIERL